MLYFQGALFLHTHNFAFREKIKKKNSRLTVLSSRSTTFLFTKFFKHKWHLKKKSEKGEKEKKINSIFAPEYDRSRQTEVDCGS